MVNNLRQGRNSLWDGVKRVPPPQLFLREGPSPPTLRYVPLRILAAFRVNVPPKSEMNPLKPQ